MFQSASLHLLSGDRSLRRARLGNGSLPVRPVLRLLLAAFLLVLPAMLCGSAHAQLRILPPRSNGAIDTVLQQGVALESQKKWGEALSYYEDALRENPEHGVLRQRADWAKLHYDLGRRYADASFRRSVLSLDERRALDLYSEVLLKIETHHFKEPDWQQLVARGTRAVDVALGSEEFINENLRHAAPERVANTARTLDTTMAAYAINSRNDAVAAVASAGRLLGRELGLRPAAVVLEYVSGAVSGLDTYSGYLTADQLREVYSQIDGNFVGLGIELKADGGVLVILNVIDGSPAGRGGIRSGDRIMAIDGMATAQMTTDRAATLLQGPENSMVDLVVAAAGGPSRQVRIRREHVDVPSITVVRIVDDTNHVGYLKLVSFQRNTSRDLDTALWKLYRLGMKSLVVDVRGNPGGLLNSAIDVADKFVRQGKIVSTRGRSRQEDYDYSAREANTWGVPLVVLVDGDSASASEIFAAAIRDHRRGTIVGTRSYGKGSVQGIFPLGAASAGLRLTTAKFYSPMGQPISNVGVSPDIVVHQVAKPVYGDTVTVETDNVLGAAVQAARRQLAQR